MSLKWQQDNSKITVSLREFSHGILTMYKITFELRETWK